MKTLISEMMKMQKEKGEAQICITLTNGKIIVRHTNQKGHILFEKKAIEGDWDKIWAAIRN